MVFLTRLYGSWRNASRQCRRPIKDRWILNSLPPWGIGEKRGWFPITALHRSLILRPISNTRRASQVRGITERENNYIFDSRSSYNARCPSTPMLHPDSIFPFPNLCCITFRNNAPHRCSIAGSRYWAWSRSCSNSGGEVIVELAADFSKLELPVYNCNS